MAESKPSTPSPPVVRSNKPVSEALLNDKVHYGSKAAPCDPEGLEF